MYCDGTQFFEKHNVRVDSLEFNSSDNNFVQVAEFTVGLSFFEAGSHGYAVKNTTDEWNIEPLEDFLPGILKTTTMGYDGKGQYVINKINDLNSLNIDFSKKITLFWQIY